ncbi:MAG: HesA/MoeB/ThiF family protein [Candidatus Heimdallarchaeota archaeon]|nr:HesA/MoeB/ThiF family protein [Candidatus Heimdallarchaeota archaeon]
MSGDESRYSRLKALEEYGIEVNWNDLRDRTIAIAGVGGVGSIVAELLARLGVHKIHIFDLDIIEDVNLNRMIYTENQVGQNKVDALKAYLQQVNPSVEVIAHHGDIMRMDFEDEFEDIISICDMGALCLDNLPARQYFNVKCVKHNVPYMDSGLLRSGLGGYIHLVIPGKTACYQCTGAVEIVNTNDATGEPCTASIPTTVNIVSSLLVQHMIKYFLKLGEIQDYISYDLITDENLLLKLARDPNCFVCGDKQVK